MVGNHHFNQLKFGDISTVEWVNINYVVTTRWCSFVVLDL